MLFDYVKRSELDAERELRIRAEAERDSARAENTRFLEMLEKERSRSELESVRHGEQLETVLKHTAPLAAEFPQSLGDDETGQQSLSALERALMMPAVGPHGVDAKRNLIRLLKSEAHQQNQKDGIPESNGDLSEGETRRVAEAAAKRKQ